jgi:hypothetical protein
MFASFLAFVLVVSGLQSGTQARDAQAVAAAKNASVHRMDPSLLDRPFAEWLQNLAGPQVHIAWEVNDCGEQTGNPKVDKGRNFPMCVEAQSALQGKRKLFVALSVGAFKTGVEAGDVRFVYAVIISASGPARSIKKLSQVPEAIKTVPLTDPVALPSPSR